MDISRARPRRVLYTVLLGGYENLNELEVSDPSVRAICFTDNPNLVSSTWELVVIEPIFPGDHIRSQRLIKILGHPILDQFDEWLYIDNTVRLLKLPSFILDNFLKDSDLAIPNHSYHKNLREEFTVVQDSSLDSFERIAEQLRHYEEHFPLLLDQQPLWTAIIARRPTLLIRKWSESWAQHVLRYSRRDQLSVLVTLEINKTIFNRIEVDNFSSDFHQWPNLNERKEDRRVYKGSDYNPDILHLQEEYLRLSIENQRLELEIRDARISENNYIKSRSWKITRPLRDASIAFRKLWQST